MKKLLMGAAALTLQSAGAASAQTTVVKRHPHQTTVVHTNRAGDRTVTRFNYRGRSWNRVHGRAWRAPPGWSYRRYTVGAYLPSTFLSAGFYIDPVGIGIGLPAAGRGRHWVRVGNDLYLVNARGRVVEVVPDVYY
jgi:Ni/Co efflux regulator RcnB